MDKYQVVIIGGGIAGLGIANACHEKGLKTLILEKNSLACATSNNSLRIMHAGFRYFQKLDISRISASIKAEAELRERFPNIIRKLKCLMPLNSFGLRSSIPLTLVGELYYLLSKILIKNYNPKTSIVKNNKLPDIYKKNKIKKAFLWHDSLLLDHLKLVDSLQKSFDESILIKENSNFLSYKKLDSNLLEVLYKEDSREIKVKTKYIVDTTLKENFNYAKGVNVVLDSKIEEEYGLAFNLKRSGLFFSVPRGLNTSIGTWYFNNTHLELKANEEKLILDDLKKILKIDVKINSYDLGLLPVKEFKNNFPVFFNKPQITRIDNYINYTAIKYTSFLIEGRKLINSL